MTEISQLTTASGDLRLTDNACPAPAGVYEVTATHTVTGTGIHESSTSPIFRTAPQQFEIRAPQFSLDPSMVQGTYPPPHSIGAYQSLLPHITFSHAVLPWERLLTAQDTGTARKPWVALLLFAHGELTTLPNGETVRNGTVKSLLASSTDQTLLLPSLSITDLPQDIQDSSARTIDVPASVFTALVPRKDELHYLAHIRRARVQRNDGTTVTAEADEGVVIGNRFPRDPGRYTAHLVSLEGHAARLAATGLDQNKTVRLVSLWSWSFTTRSDGGGNFATILDGLAREASPLRPMRPAAVMTSEVDSDAKRHVLQRLDAGYLPVAYQTASGERTTAWYRGPLSPVVPPTLPPPGQHDHGSAPAPTAQRYQTADEALIYLDKHGMFDVTYAAAFTMGQVLALAHPVLSDPVLQTRAHAHNLALRLHALTAGNPTSRSHPVRPPDGEIDPNLLRQHLEPGTLRRHFDRIIGSLTDRLSHPASPPSHDASITPGEKHPERAHPQASIERIAALIADTDIRDTLRRILTDALETTADSEITATAADPSDSDRPNLWLPSVIELLGMLPFDHLIPHVDSMLPPESLRFFYVDSQWLQVLRDGIASTGLHTRLDQIMAPVVDDVVNPEKSSLRRTGFLLRSQLVRYWPNLVIDAYETVDSGSARVWSCRQDTLAPDTLLCVFDGVPARVEIREPNHELHFGLDVGDRFGLRRLKKDADKGIGSSLNKDFPGGNGSMTRHFRPSTAPRAVLNLASSATQDTDTTHTPLIPALNTVLRDEYQLSSNGSLTAAGLALQLLNTPYVQIFTISGAPS